MPSSHAYYYHNYAPYPPYVAENQWVPPGFQPNRNDIYGHVIRLDEHGTGTIEIHMTHPTGCNLICSVVEAELPRSWSVVYSGWIAYP